MKVAVCCICKNEEKYIKDFVDYYINIGCCTIIIYDNNDKNNDSQKKILTPYIESNDVIYYDLRGHAHIQENAYIHCYYIHKTDFDWICFFDCDEFLAFTNTETTNISKMLSNNIYKNANVILVNWLIYTDSNKTYYEDKPVWDRFTDYVEADKKGYIGNKHTKCIVKCINNAELLFDKHPHGCNFMNIKTKAVNSNGCANNSPMGGMTYPPILENMYLKHFMTKTIVEYLDRKVNTSGISVTSTTKFSVDDACNLFFSVNKRSPEKDILIHNYKIKHNLS